MGFRIAMWAIVGALIASGWGLYFAWADKAIPIGPMVFTLSSITQPVAAVVGYFRLPFGLTAAVAWNAGAFAVIGLIVEVLGRHKHALGLLRN
jgi:hypothetical protein